MGTFAGWQIDAYIKTGSGNYIRLDGIQRVSFKLVEGIDAKEECGTRYTTLIEGVYGSTCSIERFYTGPGPWVWFDKGEAALEYFTLQIYPNKSGSGKAFIQLNGLKLQSTSPSYRPAANLMTESWDFIGTGSITTGTND